MGKKKAHPRYLKKKKRGPAKSYVSKVFFLGIGKITNRPVPISHGMAVACDSAVVRYLYVLYI